MIEVTEKAATEVQRILDEQALPDSTALRVGVKGGGCSGFSYTLGFDDQINEIDQMQIVAPNIERSELDRIIRSTQYLDFQPYILLHGLRFTLELNQ